MKTSTKIFTGFIGLLVLLMLCTDILLRANYSKGITNTQSFHQQSEPPVVSTLPSFKILVLINTRPGTPLKDTTTTYTEGDVTATQQNINMVNIYKSDINNISLPKKDNFSVRTAGDTLFLTIPDNQDLLINCASLEQVYAKACSLSFHEYKSDYLKAHTGANTETYFYNSTIRSLVFTGGAQSKFYMDESNQTDSLELKLGKAAELTFRGGYKYGNIQVDSLREMNISGDIVSRIKQIN